METKINIAEILKDKPEGTKLWTDMFGSVTLYVVTDACDAFQVKHHNKEPWFDKEGKLYKEGVLCIYPSKSMRDWEKFAWEKGDVLVYRNCEEFYYTIFEGFQDDEYTQFKSRYCNNSENRWLQSKVGITDLFTKVSDEEAKRFIKKIEECYNGKLNLDTLEIEKPEFKDGDIVYADYGNKQAVFIVSGKTDLSEGYNSFIALDLRGLTLDMGCMSFFKEDLCKLRLAKEEEKKQLFDALTKASMAWDAEKKQIVDLKPKCEFKPFDKVLCRNSKDDTWEADFFARLTRKEIDYTQSGKYLCVGDLWMYCIPYNEETAHLLGTTDEWKGGEQ